MYVPRVGLPRASAIQPLRLGARALAGHAGLGFDRAGEAGSLPAAVSVMYSAARYVGGPGVVSAGRVGRG